MAVIGICGLIGSGKGTAADILVENHGYKKISFADALKDGVAAMFGYDRALLEGDTAESREWREKPDKFWTKECGEDMSPRLILQLVGTDAMREGFFKDVWVAIVKKQIQENPDVNWVIADCRFPNEQNVIKELGGQVWHVRRGDEPDWWDTAVIANSLNDSEGPIVTECISVLEDLGIHSSEYSFAREDEYFNEIIDNNGTLDELKNQVSDRLASTQSQTSEVSSGSWRKSFSGWLSGSSPDSRQHERH